MGGGHGPAVFLVLGAPNARFVIQLPQEIVLHGPRGVVRLREFVSSPPHFGTLGADGKALVYVGATLDLGHRPSTGHYEGELDGNVSVLEN